MKVVYFFRKKSPEFNSIEMLFSGLIEELRGLIEPTVLNVPSNRANFSGIMKNSLFAWKGRGQLVHVTGHVNYLTVFTGRKTILTIHDVGSSIYRRRFLSLIFDYLWFKIPIIFARRITVISEFTRDEVLKLSPNSLNKIRVIPNPVHSEFSYHPSSFNIQLPKILIVGTKSNKNLERIFSALAGLSCELVILGKLTSPQISLLQSLGITYTNLFNLSLMEVTKVYQNCDLLCFPSTYEGFGLPILEAQATGRPVITSNLGAMKEVAGDTACLVNPFDVKSIRDGVDKIIQDKLYRDGLVRKGLDNVKKYKIEAIAQQYYSLYKEVELE